MRLPAFASVVRQIRRFLVEILLLALGVWAVFALGINSAVTVCAALLFIVWTSSFKVVLTPRERLWIGLFFLSLFGPLLLLSWWLADRSAGLLTVVMASAGLGLGFVALLAVVVLLAFRASRGQGPQWLRGLVVRFERWAATPG